MSAIRPHLTISINPNFSHPHNDIFAGTIGGGVLAGLFSLFSLCSPIFAHLFNPNRSNNTLFMAIGLSISFLVTANVNTIFFNDAACAWLIFSTFLIWRLKKVKSKSFNFQIDWILIAIKTWMLRTLH